MNPLLDNRQKEGLARLFVGFALNIGLWFVHFGLGKQWGNERDILPSLIAGSLAIATLVFVTPVFWRGAPWQAPIAFVLIFFLPGIVLFSVVLTILEHW